eukprot:gene39287-47817_t
MHSNIETNSYVELEVQLVNILVDLHPEYKPFIDNTGQVFLKLDKAVPGSMESDMLCYRHVFNTLVSLGFVANPQEPCVLNKCGRGGAQLTVTMHLHELKASCVDRAALEELVAQLMAVYRSVSVQQGKVLDYLGMKFDYTEEGVCGVHMCDTVQEMISECSVDEAVATPAIAEDRAAFMAPPTSSLKNPRLVGSDHGRFLSILQRLRFMSPRVRPDILLPVSFLASRATSPTKTDKKKLDRVLKYLKGSASLALRLGFSEDFVLTASLQAFPQGAFHCVSWACRFLAAQGVAGAAEVTVRDIQVTSLPPDVVVLPRVSVAKLSFAQEGGVWRLRSAGADSELTAFFSQPTLGERFRKQRAQLLNMPREDIQDIQEDSW